MPDQLQLRGGTTVQHSTFTGASKEVTVDTTKKTVVVHDGSTAGGNPMLREDASNSALALGSAGTPSLKFTGDTNTGIYSPGADQVSVATGGTERLRIDSTGQIEAVSLGTAAAPTFTFTGDPDTGVYSPGANQLAISTGGSGRLFVDSSGNIGINVASPTQARLVVASSAGANTGYFTDGTNSTIKFLHGGGGAVITTEPGQYLGLGTADTERMRITNGGNVFINSTSNPALGTEMFGVAAQASGQTTAAGFSNTVNTAPTIFVSNTSNTTNTYLMRFASGSGGTTRGEIYYNGSQLVYATSSDYRLKEDVINFDGGIEIVKQLRPVRYNWIESGNQDIGFIAHEVQAVFPNAVGGEKDAVDNDGKILPQTYDPSKLVPLLTAALQEAVAKIESLEARLTAAGI